MTSFQNTSLSEAKGLTGNRWLIADKGWVDVGTQSWGMWTRRWQGVGEHGCGKAGHGGGDSGHGEPGGHGEPERAGIPAVKRCLVVLVFRSN